MSKPTVDPNMAFVVVSVAFIGMEVVGQKFLWIIGGYLIIRLLDIVFALIESRIR